MHHVLVVDDVPAIRSMVMAALSSEGFRVAGAADGLEALHQITADKPLMVLLDMAMPGMDGRSVLQELQAQQAGIPVIFMSAAHDIRWEAERYHADGYLAKPFDLDALIGIVERYAPPPAGA